MDKLGSLRREDDHESETLVIESAIDENSRRKSDEVLNENGARDDGGDEATSDIEETDDNHGDAGEKSQQSTENALTLDDHFSDCVYRPVRGEDIYGRTIDSSANNAKSGGRYIPPALRKQAPGQSDAVVELVDEV